MALIEFKDLPDKSTLLNSTNLNNNFNELNNGLNESNKNQETLKNRVDIKGKTLKCGILNNQSVTATTITQILFNNYLNNNFDNDYDNFFKLSDGYIEIMNEDIKCVIVIASVQTNDITDQNLYINKSGKGRYSVATNATNGNQCVAIIPVSKGDKIYAEIYGNVNGAISNWTDMTFLEIVAI